MNKLQKLKEQHELEEFDMQVNEVKAKNLKRAYLFLGGIHAVKNIAKAFDSQHLRGVEAIETEKLYLDMGFETFVEFLASEESPISKTQYYTRIKLLETEGDQVFDLLNEIGVAKATRKLLSSGNYDAITIDGDTLKIGEETADLTNARLVRTLIESYADDCKRLKTESEKKTEKISKLQSQVETGANQYQKLQRAIDAASGGHPHDIAFMRLLSAFVNLKNEAVNLSDEEKANFAPNIFAEIAAKLDSLSVAYNRVSKSTTNNADYSEPDDGTTDWQTREHRRRLKKVQSDENKNAEIAEVNDDELADLMD